MSPLWLPNHEQTEALNEIINLLKEKHIKLILVPAPVTKSYYQYLQNNAAIDSFFASKATYYNFNKLLNLRVTSYFYDSNHLKLQGVKVFNEAFIKICLSKDKGNIPQ